MSELCDDNLNSQCPEVISTEEPIIQLTENGVEGFEVLCRICANRSDHLIPIYSEEGVTNDLADKMNLYLPIKVSKTDLLPLQCCFQCATTVLTWHELVIACVEANRRLTEVQSEVEKQFAEQTPEAGPSQVDTVEDDRGTTYLKLLRPEITIEHIKEDSMSQKLVSRIIKKQPEKENKLSDDNDSDIDSVGPFLIKQKRKTFQCAECNKHFFQKTSLERHMRIHRNERPFTCDICGKGFRDKSGLIRHINHVHNGIKNFPCAICPKKFASATTRDDHQRSHTKECPFVCPVCGKAFGRKASLNIHSKIHSNTFPFDCNVCKKRFRRRHELTNHVLTHSGVKQFHCADCDKSFRLKSSLNMHKLIHSKIKPYSCVPCGISYRQARYLRKHNILKH